MPLPALLLELYRSGRAGTITKTGQCRLAESPILAVVDSANLVVEADETNDVVVCQNSADAKQSGVGGVC
ncbi:MAG: hypothetical protein BMS9Abin37_1532 [Acidobacteriota bacterium]|nr:MAG: hypothetical protein BMS9Abin37_1532 [Acidobacteriota bacterium]